MQKLGEAVEFAENPEPRCPCVLLIDVSGSMQGEPMEALNAGLRVFHEDLQKDSLTMLRVEVAVVTFSSTVTMVQDFVTADLFQPSTLEASGLTHMGSGIMKALDMIQARKQDYKANSVAYYRPWIFLITDGAPQGEQEHIIAMATRRVHQADANKSVAFYTVGVEGADMDQLRSIAPPSRQPLKLRGLSFRELFAWLSSSMTSISHSNPDDQVPLPPVGWGTA